MHVAVFGAGSVGGYVGGMMADAGMDITLVDAWPEHIEAIRENGLRLTGTQGERAVQVAALTISEVQSLRRKSIDVALLCVKSYDTAWMTTLIHDYLSPSGYIVSMQNGMNEDVIAGVVGWGRVAGCVLNTIGVELTAPGEIFRWFEPAAPGYSVFRLGEVHGQLTQRLQELAACLQKVDNASVTTNLWGERWSKLANNAMASAIGPIVGVSIREMYGDPELRRLSIRAVVETVRVGLGMGLPLESICGIPAHVWLATAGTESPDYTPVEQGLREFEKRIGAAGQASTLHDLRRGRRMEIDAINGLVAAKGREIGVPTPLHTELTAIALDVELGRTPQGRAALAHLYA